MKITKEMLAMADIKKGQSYSINPAEIVVDKELNPRLDYGDKDSSGNESDEWISFKNSIKDNGIQQHLKVYFDEGTKSFHLVHGFRRMKALQELLDSGDADLHEIEYVGIDIVEDNKENAIIGHFLLNSGKSLNDVEMAEGLKRLKAQSGEDNVAELARKIGLPYQKVHNLLMFAENAGEQLKKAVVKNDISFNAAKSIINKTKGVRDQVRLLKETKDNAEKTGKKITAAKIDETRVNLETKIGNVISEVSKHPEINVEALNMFKALVKAIKNNTSIEDMIPIFNIHLEVAEA